MVEDKLVIRRLVRNHSSSHRFGFMIIRNMCIAITMMMQRWRK